MKRRPVDVKLREELLQMQRKERVRERAVGVLPNLEIPDVAVLPSK